MRKKVSGNGFSNVMLSVGDFESFYRANYRKAVEYASSFSKPDAEDMAQDAFIKLLERMRAAKRIRNLESMFHVILRNTCRDWQRNLNRRAEIEELHPAL